MNVETTDRVNVANVTLAELADFAKLVRKVRCRGASTLFTGHVLIRPRGMTGGDPFGVMIATTTEVQGDVTAIAVPLDVITEAAKRARKLSVRIRPGVMEREDGAAFSWQDPSAEQYAQAWQDHRDAFGERVGAARLSAVFAASEWETAASGVIVAASKDETRPVLTSVMLRTSEPVNRAHGAWTTVQLVATDSYRAHFASVLADVTDSTSDPVIIPAKAIQVTLGAKAGSVEVDARESDAQRVHLTLRRGDATLMRVSSRTVEGQYPNVERFHPDHPESTPRTLLASACADAANVADVMRTAASVAAKGKRRAHTIIMYAEGASVRVSVRGGEDAPSGEWTIPALVTGRDVANIEDAEVGANGGFVADAAAAIARTADDAVITTYGPQAPFVITQTDADAATRPVGLWCIVMPIRVT